MDINLKSVYIGCVIAGKLMQEQNSGVIINASSFAAIIPSIGSGAYAASKSSIISMTKSFAAELAPYQVRVNSYIPGVIDTDMTSEVIREKHDALIENIALKRIGLVSEVAEPILFLCSDAASYITGTSLEISGGKYCVQS